MLHKRPLGVSAVILLSWLPICLFASTTIPRASKLNGVPRIKQKTNYCGPAVVAAVMQYYGATTTQDEVGQVVYDSTCGATNGADMLLFAREKGFSAYSWNSSFADARKKLAAGFPIIVLQQNSMTDVSGHYRVLTGYDDTAEKFHVMDPYYDNITELSYADAEKMWKRMGNWALLVVPASKDTFKAELDTRNPVVHMDLSYARYKRGEYDVALSEARLALALEPTNSYAKSMLGKIQAAMGAGANAK